MFLKKYSAAEFVVYKHVYEAPRSINRLGSCKVCTGGTPPEPTQPRCGVKLGPPPPSIKSCGIGRGGTMPGKGLNLPHGVKGEEGVVQPPAALALGEGWGGSLGDAEPSVLGNLKSQAQREPKGQGLPPPCCDTRWLHQWEMLCPMAGMKGALR